MASRNVESFMAAHQAFNGRDFDAAVILMAENMVFRDQARNVTFQGRGCFKAFLQELVAAFSDVQVTQPAYIDAGESVIAQFSNTGNNDGPLGPMPATRKPINIPMCEILRFNDKGQVISGDLYYDQLSIMVQLGHVQAPQKECLGLS